MPEKKPFITSTELEELLFAKRDGKITETQNERLGNIADNFANIILRTPKMRNFLSFNDPDGFLDISNQIRAQIIICIMANCPVNFDKDAGRAYSYCLACAYGEACDVMRRHNRRLELGRTIGNVYLRYSDRTGLSSKKVTRTNDGKVNQYSNQVRG